MAGRFEFFEIVRVDGEPEGLEYLCGKAGPVLGKAECDDGSWTYAVYLEDLGESFSLSEDDLSGTGRFVRREDIYDGSSIRVPVNPKTGDGKPVE